MGNVYLLVTDLHDSYKNKENRHGYLDEIEMVKSKLVNTIKDYTLKGNRVTTIFLGDVFDNGFKSIIKSVNSNNFIVSLRQMCGGGVYSVVGNHEFTYYKDNPFWTLITNVESDKIRNSRHTHYTPLGIIPVIQVPDVIEDGEVVFHFNHYGTPDNKPIEGKVNIGLYHKDIICKDIIEDAKSKGMALWEGNPVYFDRTNVFEGYQHTYLGHMHKVYGSWEYTNEISGSTTVVNYLGSLGRPNHTEVNDNMLERNIPAIIVEDGKFKCIEDNKFNLFSREESVKADIIEGEKENYERVKSMKQLKEYNPIADNPIQEIKQVFNNPVADAIIDGILGSSKDSILEKIEKECEELRWI